MTNFNELENLITELNNNIKSAVFCKACSREAEERNFKRPVVCLSAESREDMEAGETLVRVKMLIPFEFGLSRAERIFAEAFALISARCPTVISVARDAPRKEKYAVALEGRLTLALNGGAAFKLNGRELIACKIDLSVKNEDREIFSVGMAAPSALIEGCAVYRGKITGCMGLRAEDKGFTLEYGGYRYADCRWETFKEGGGLPLAAAEFVSRERIKLEETAE